MPIRINGKENILDFINVIAMVTQTVKLAYLFPVKLFPPLVGR